MAKRRPLRSRRRVEVIEAKRVPTNLTSVDDGRGWMSVFDSGTDAQYWQKNLRPAYTDAHRNPTVFSCETLIAGDISKLAVMLLEEVDDVWQETKSPSYQRFLRKPNGFQTWQQFCEQWILSKLSRGNAYVLMERDLSTRVAAAYVLNPDRVQPLVATDGSVYYRLKGDDLAQVPEDGDVVVPASEIMHDRMNCLFHSLVGLSPLFASSLAAHQGLTIQEQSELFFRNASRPGGMLVSPQMIGDKQALEYKRRWEESFGGSNRGRTAVLGNGLKYEMMAQSAVDSDLVRQMEMSDKEICRTYHVPPFKVFVGDSPAYDSAEQLDQIYYSNCLQRLIEAVEALLDSGLELDDVGGRTLRARFDLDGLLRMDSRTQIEALGAAVKAGVMAPNEARKRMGLPPVDGGDSPYMQQQQFSLEALAERDASKPFAKPSKPAPAAAAPSAAANDPSAEDAAKNMTKGLSLFARELDTEMDHAAA